MIPIRLNKKIVIILICTTFCIKAYSQQLNKTYYSNIDSARKYSQIKDYISAAQFYKKSFEATNGYGLIIDHYNAACVYTHVGWNDSAFGKLERLAFKSKYRHYDFMMADQDFKPLKKSNRWRSIEKKVLLNKNEFEKNYKKKIIKKLDSINEIDQSLRKKLFEIVQSPTPDSIVKDSLIQILERNDKKNQQYVSHILRKFGWLDSSYIGENGSFNIFLIIQHAPLAFQKEMLSILEKAINEKKTAPKYYAYLKDRILVSEGKLQLYGTQFGLDESNKNFLYPLENTQNIHLLRIQFGLEPLDQICKQMHVSFENLESYNELAKIKMQKQK